VAIDGLDSADTRAFPTVMTETQNIAPNTPQRLPPGKDVARDELAGFFGMTGRTNYMYSYPSPLDIMYIVHIIHGHSSWSITFIHRDR
jgi:hypothetical protein